MKVVSEDQQRSLIMDMVYNNEDMVVIIVGKVNSLVCEMVIVIYIVSR